MDRWPVLLVTLPKFASVGVRVGSRPVGVIGKVEGIEAEGEELILEGLEALLQTGVVVCRARADENIAGVLRGKGSCGWSRKDGCRLRSLLNHELESPRDREFAIALQGCSGGDADSSWDWKPEPTPAISWLVGYAEGSSGLELVGLRELPATENLVREAAAAVEGKTVDGVDGEHLTNVVVRVAAQSFGVEEVRQEVLLEGTAVLRMSEGVRHAEAEIAAVAVVHVDL